MIKPPLTPPKEGNNFPPEGGLRGAFSHLEGGRGMFWVRYFRAESPTYISVGQRPTQWSNGGNNEIAGQARNDGNRRDGACPVLTNRNDGNMIKNDGNMIKKTI